MSAFAQLYQFVFACVFVEEKEIVACVCMCVCTAVIEPANKQLEAAITIRVLHLTHRTII